MIMGHLGRCMTLGLVALGLSACVASPPVNSPRPETRGVLALPDAGPQSALSRGYASYYASIEQRLVANGLLRTDGGGDDTPFSRRMLVANFERIALFDEYALTNGRFVARQTPSRLRRWEVPVRIQAHFGPSLSAAARSDDSAVIGTYAQRLARATGHPIRKVSSGGNFHVLFVSRDEQQLTGPLLQQLVPGIGPETLREISNLPRHTFCSVYAFSEAGGTPVYQTAVAIIRTEHPDLLRRSCIHEEIAQGLGLPNDSPAARPSIFNDDEEFALLTRHDELLLRILYDPRLRPGMEPAAARPIVAEIAAELLGGSS